MISDVQPSHVEALASTAETITNYGIMTTICALTIISMFLMFRHFMKQNADMFNKILSSKDGAYLYETPMEQIRVMQSALFDLAKYEVLVHLIRIHSENNLHDKEMVRQKIIDVLTNIHNDRNSKLDNFKYHGLKLSEFTSPKWVARITELSMKQIYMNEKNFEYKRAYSALDIAYNHIKIEFYNNIITRS